MITRLRIALVVVAATMLVGSMDLSACGDKFLRLGRVLRLAHSAYPSSILIYSGADAEGAAKQLRLSETLKQAGHRVKEVKRDAELAPAFKSGPFDLVFGSVSSAASVQSWQSSARAARFVPLLHKPTAEQRAAAEQQFGAVLTSAVTSQELVAQVDSILRQSRNTSASR